MGLLSGNSCNIITLFPLGLDCNAINSSTPESSNGVVTLFVTGGTPPYNITWNNGGQGNLLTNLRPGEYTATVVDYYGDFSATTTCEVGYNSFYLEQFESCTTPGSYLYYIADMMKPFTAGTIYNLSSQSGCWTSSGQTLYTGQTYITTIATTSAGPFTGCTQCLPTPTPVPVYPSNLCLQQTQNNTTTQYNFVSGSTINGYPSWSSVSPSYTMYYNTGTTQWTVSGWTNGSIYNQTNNIPPTGGWVITGPNAFNTSINVVTGTCPNPPLIIQVQPTGPSCSTNNNGSATIVGYGGVPAYTYSLDGVNYQASSVFLNLAVGTYTAYIKDSLNTVTSQSFTITAQVNFQNYNVSLTLTPGNPVVVGNALTKTSQWSITVSPTPLPAGVTVNMNLAFNINSTGYTSYFDVPVITNTITTATNPNATVTLVSTGTTSGSSSVRPNCLSSFINVSARTQSYTVQLSTNGFASGTIVQYISTPCHELPNCPIYGNLVDTIVLSNITITPAQCRSISQNVQPKQVSHTKTGLSCL
jgi:hypothetical protein